MGDSAGEWKYADGIHPIGGTSIHAGVPFALEHGSKRAAIELSRA
jgi:hypothetical protein